MAAKSNCKVCGQSHSIYSCPTFVELDPRERYKQAKQLQLCLNCLGDSHSLKNCRSTKNCRTCGQQHHSLLHFSKNETKTPPATTNTSTPAQSTNTLGLQSLNSGLTGHLVLLSTAIVQVVEARGNFVSLRALLDSGSQASFITEKAMRRLGLKRDSYNASVIGLDQTPCKRASGRVNCEIKGLHSSSLSSVDCIVLPSICGPVPSTSLKHLDWDYVSKLKLADPNFHTPSNVDVLLSADIVASSLNKGRLSRDKDSPTAIETNFGWVLMGTLKRENVSIPLKTSLLLNVDIAPPLESMVKRFWELEQVSDQNLPLSADDRICDEIFVEDHCRNSDGRYVVPLPFKETNPTFGDSRSSALKRLATLERRLEANPRIQQDYNDSMHEFLDDGYMSPINSTDCQNSERSYYIPHHFVQRPKSLSTKLRVVFDASNKSSDGRSLNDVVYPGPKLQKNLPAILLNFRSHEIALVADIKRMFLQILIKEDHRDFHKILWRFSLNESVQEFRLNTVTFGVTSSPYLALRVIQQLVEDEGSRYPLASAVAQSDIYVDDIVTGASSVEKARQLAQELTSLFNHGGFELRKWVSNNSDALTTIPDNQTISFDREEPSYLKILGLQWKLASDSFCFRVVSIDQPFTKPGILSGLARIFDPLGLLTPVTLFAKHLIQYLWIIGSDWDEPVPENVHDTWSRFNSSLEQLTSISLPRFVLRDQVSIQLHGFCDASERGFAGVVYLRVVNSSGRVEVHLLVAKSKVAPAKRVCIPRLELCGAPLLSDLLLFVARSFRVDLDHQKVFAWSDAKTVLAWIKSPSTRWKTFVANPVSHIQERVPSPRWSYVPSSENPADCASRGLLPCDLVDNPLWWAEPSWLKQEPADWPSSSIQLTPEDESGEERHITLTNSLEVDNIIALLDRYSSLRKILRIFAYIFRFGTRLTGLTYNSVPSDWELARALNALVRIVQASAFEKELDLLKAGQQLSKSMRKLSPFVDEYGLLRVGGRLKHSSLSQDAKHPKLLPSYHRLTVLIIEEYHSKNMHPGPQTLHYLLQEQFWILSSRRAINRVVSRCIRCFKCKPQPCTPLMGDLPSFRVSQVKPFSHAGVDFAGPFLVTATRKRGVVTSKAYICLFVCCAVKALHLELVSDLSSEAFLAAFRRFLARRGRCSHIYSDQGTNFVGAWNILQRHAREASEKLGLQWHFNPPASPHFGGLWEAGVKSTKTHLQRVIGEQMLSYEELNTVIIQLEGLLNSRPLMPMSSSPDDLQALTPGHFLVLEPLVTPYQDDETDVAINRLTRWKLVQRLHFDFWKRWHSEYLHHLQQRSKWTKGGECAIVPGSLVIIKQESCPPLRWPLARVVAVNKGHDNIVRVATVRTAAGELRRPLVKLCPLPSQ